MADDPRRIERWRQAREALLAAEREGELLGPDSDLLARYAGQWIVVQGGRVVASATSGHELVKIANGKSYPNAVVVHVPALDQQNGVHIP